MAKKKNQDLPRWLDIEERIAKIHEVAKSFSSYQAFLKDWKRYLLVCRLIQDIGDATIYLCHKTKSAFQIKMG